MIEVASLAGPIRGRTVSVEVTGRGSVSVANFAGIPFGIAPVGQRRLRRSVRPDPWTEPYEAVQPKDRCVQPPSMLAPANESESEDCLGLNIWTPGIDGCVPTMLWIHCGSFTTGSGAMAVYGGARLAARGVVVVTINYRLGPLGFLALDTAPAEIGGELAADVTANLGLDDQRLALEWVRDHIEAFGGDPQRVTLFGESAGAMSVAAHLAAPASAGLFERAILQSGAARHVQSLDRARTTSAQVVELLGLDPAAPDRAALESIDAARFAAVVDQVHAGDPRTDLPLPFRPIVGDTVLPVAPLDAIAAGSSAGVVVLAGTNADEMKLFHLMAVLAGASPDLDDERLARRLAHALGAWGSAAEPADVLAAYRAHCGSVSNAELWAAIGADTTFRMPMIEMLDAHCRAGGIAYAYLFEHAATGFGGGLGAAHAVELPFVFDTLDSPGIEMLIGEITEARRRLASDVADRWVDFAYGRELTLPGAGAPVAANAGERPPTWPRYDDRSRTIAVIDLESRIETHYRDDLRRVWLGG